MIEGGGEPVGRVALADERTPDASPEIVAVVGNKVGQVHTLAVIPQLLGGVEFRCVGRQPLDHDLWSILRTSAQPAPDALWTLSLSCTTISGPFTCRSSARRNAVASGVLMLRVWMRKTTESR